MNNFITDCFLYGMYLLIFLLCVAWVSGELRIRAYKRSVEKSKRYEQEELLRFGRNVKTLNTNI